MLAYLNKLYHPTSNQSLDSKGRIAFADNLRVVLILLVVLGHFLLHMDTFTRYRYLNNFIYLFHMPSFIFITGYFSKSICKNGVFRADKVTSMFWLFILFQISVFTLAGIYKPATEFHLLYVSAAPWYMLSMCTWFLFVPILSYYKARYMIPLTFLIGLLAGMDTTIGTFLSFSRTLVFLPFFAMGFYLSQDRFTKLLNLRLRIPAFFIFFGTLIFVLTKGELLKPYVQIVYGGASYQTILKGNKAYGPLLRFIWYVIAIVLSLCLFYLIPRCKMWFTYIGQRTLSVYVLHILLRNWLVYEGVMKWLTTSTKPLTLIIFPISILIVWFFSLNWFHRFFNFLLSHPFFFSKSKRS